MSQPGYQPQPGAGGAGGVPGQGQGSPGFDPRYSYVSSAGVPTPSSLGNTNAGFPTPYQNMAPSVYGSSGGQLSPQFDAHDFYKPPGSDAGTVYPSSVPSDQQQYGNYAQPSPLGNIAEAPAVNPVGTGNNRAELA